MFDLLRVSRMVNGEWCNVWKVEANLLPWMCVVCWLLGMALGWWVIGPIFRRK